MAAAVCVGSFACACCNAEPATAPSEPAILADADKRIDTYRKGDGIVQVTDSEGKPIPGARVTIRQTRHAFLFGANIFKWGTCHTEAQEKRYRSRFKEVFNYATLPFYWWSYEPQQGRPNHDYRRRVATWCRANDITPKGHPLAWNYGEPSWLPEESGEIVKQQLDRITDCVSRFTGLIDRWDVVNEAAHFDRADLMKRAPRLTNAWKQVGQVEFARRCFQAARAANPEAVLLTNDYNTDEAYVKVIEQLVDGRGKRLYDVIGIQSHMHGGVWPVKKVWEVCDRFKRFGVPLHFTEVTVLSGELGWELTQKRPGFKWESTPEGLKSQAQQVQQFYTVLFSHPAVEAITWWDFCDQGAWQRAPAGWLDDEMNPKPVFEAMKRLIKERWWTQLEQRTDGDGQVSFRGFRGDYSVTVEMPDGRTTTRDLALGATGRVQIGIE